jgi:cobaltochelatase CobN
MVFRRMLIVFIVIVCITGMVQASTFHGNEQRTGNFSITERIVPSLAWKTELTGLVGATPVYWNGHVFVTNWYGWGDWSPGLYSLNASTGKIEWRNEAITGASSIAVSDGVIVVGSLSGSLYYVNASDGSIIKSVTLENNPSWWGIASSPLVYNNKIYVTTFSNGALHALNESGNVEWSFVTGGSISHYTSPSAYSGMIFFAGNDTKSNRLYCVDDSGNELWNFSVESMITNTPSIGYGKVFFATENRLYALNLDGSKAWDIPFNGTMSTAATAYGYIYIGSKDGVLYCVDAITGNIIWQYAANGKIDSSPAVAGGVVYFATNTPQGTIYALDAYTGDLMWFYQLTPPSGYYYNIMSSPFLAEDKLFIGSDSGYVYCFDSSGEIEVNVTLSPGSFNLDVNGNSYQVNNTSALGALHEASLGGKADGAVIGFGYAVDDSWYAQYGSLLVTSIFGLSNSVSDETYWFVWVNDSPLSVGVNSYELSDGDAVYYFYDVWTKTPQNASYVIKINTKIEKAGISSFTASSAARGGNVTVWANITTMESGWFVLVVSGTNEEGEALAGVSTFYASSNEQVSVPVLIHVPQQLQTGTYRLYAGIYRLNEYPNNLLKWYGYITCEVS